MDEEKSDNRTEPGQPGIGVDKFGGQVVDPTKNVEDLVEAKSRSDQALRESDRRFLDAQIIAIEKLQNYAREAGQTFQNFAREKSEQYLKSQIDSETRRIDQLAETRQEFQNTIRDMLAESVRTTSTLVSTQLVQIQATFDTRVSKLEAQAFTAAGRSSVADPAIEGAITRMSQGIASLSMQTAETMSKVASSNQEAIAKVAATLSTMQTTEAMTSGKSAGVGMSVTAIVQLVTVVGVAAAVLGVAIAFLNFNRSPAVVESATAPHVQRQSAPLYFEGPRLVPIDELWR